MVYPDLALVRRRRLDRATWIIIGNFECHFVFRVLHIWVFFFLSPPRPHSLVGFCLRYFSDIGRTGHSVLPIVSPFLVSLLVNMTSWPNQSMKPTALFAVVR
jgi:hypothetical protein